MKISKYIYLLSFLALSCSSDIKTDFSDDPSYSVVLCHLNSDDSFQFIKIALKDLDIHLAHGDAYPNECYMDLQYMSPDCILYDNFHRIKCFK